MGNPTSITSPTTHIPVAKSKKRKVQNDEQAEGAAESKRSKKRKKGDLQDLGGANGTEGPMTKAKLSVQESAVTTEAPGNERGGGSEARKKKRKKGNTDDTKVEIDPDVPKTRKRRNKTGFPDPNEDTSLTGQARKGLGYAFTRFHRPSKWKFNKARQNWLIRNAWTKETIPETHLPLVVRYLADVQGGVRTNLVKACRAALEQPGQDVQPDDQKTPSDEAKRAEQNLPALDKLKQNRAQVILDALGLSEGIL